MHVLHPLFVHLHIALLLMAFITMYYWLFKGLATSIFENRIYSLARLNTTAGLVFVVLSMVFGIRDGLAGNVASFDSPLGKWLYVKAILATLIVLVYGAFLYASRKKPQYLQEDPTIMCLVSRHATGRPDPRDRRHDHRDDARVLPSWTGAPRRMTR